MYEFRDIYEKKWQLNLIKGNCPPIDKIDPSLPPAARSAARKTEGLKNILDQYKFKGVIAGIRRDEQGTRAKERIFSQEMSQVNGMLKINPRILGSIKF